MTAEGQIASKLNKALFDYHLVEDGDKVLIGLSGGADSLTMTHFMSRRMEVTHPSFQVEALHVRMDNVEYLSDGEYLQEFCEERGVRLHVRNASFEEDRLKKRTPCFLCSWMRRKVLFEFAQENGFNKIALGHHQDDLIITLMMNQLFEGSFDTMPLMLKMKKMPLTIIRPMGLIEERLLKNWAETKDYQPQLKHCPHERASNRTAIKSVLAEMEKLNADYRNSIMHALKKNNKLIEI